MTSRRTLPSLALLAVLSACGGRAATAQAAPSLAPSPHPPTQASPAFIEVSGSATVSVTPDRVRASFAVETRAADATAAAAKNAELMNAVIRALRGTGVSSLEIETFGYSLRPEYGLVDQPGQAPTIVAYSALNSVRATASDVSAAGRLIDAAIRSGANRVSSLGFEASDIGPARREALARAVRSATEQAEAMARALGRTLGPPLEVRGGAEQPYPRALGEVMFRAAEAVDTPVEAADLTVSANVTIRFALGGAVEGR